MDVFLTLASVPCRISCARRPYSELDKQINPSACLGEQIKIDTGIVVKSFKKSSGRENTEVAVSRLIFSEKNEVKSGASIYLTAL